MVGVSGMTLTKLLYLSVSTHLPPALGLCPTADLAANPLRVLQGPGNTHDPVFGSQISNGRRELSFFLTSSALLSQEAKALLK